MFKAALQRIYLVGIGGVGMGGIAEVLHNLGYQVSGSDVQENAMVLRLKQLGIKVYSQHLPAQIEGVDVVVVSSGVAADNPEIQAAKAQRIPVVPRAMMLSELMRFKQGIAVAGAHGKTTTTSLVASLLAEGGCDPTFVIGGKLNALGCHAKLGAGDYFVAEADESDASFLYLSPTLIILTNIDRDHLEAYQNDYQRLKDAYLQFIHRLPFYGLLILCHDDPEIVALLPKIERPYLSYGFHPKADFRLRDYRQVGIQSEFWIERPKGGGALPIHLNLPGEHNALNACAAVMAALEVGVSEEKIQQALVAFQGVGRRFQLLGSLSLPQGGEALFIDDYGHHPNEMIRVIQAAKMGWPGQRLVMVYQPHRYTRLRDLFGEFVKVLLQADRVVLLPLYAAGEKPIEGYNSATLAAAMGERVRHLDHKQDLQAALQAQLLPGDIVLMQGAGDIHLLSQSLMQQGLLS